MNTTCPSCGMPTLPNASFCAACGATLAATKVHQRTVPISVAPKAPTNSVAAPPTALQPLAAASVYKAVTSAFPVQREETVFLNDVSGSMGGQYDGRFIKLEASMRASFTMVLQKAQIDPQDEIGLVVFDDQAQVLMPICPIATHKAHLIQAIQSMTVQGGTDINEGLKAARDLFDWNRQGVVRRIVLLTDGQGGHPLRTAEELKSRGVVIDVIGVGANPSGVDERLLKQVASTVQGELRYRFIRDQQTLINHYTELAGKTQTSP